MISTYLELENKRNQKEYKGVFFAYNQEQYDKGMEMLKDLWEDGDTLYSFCGMYGIQRYVDEMMDYWHKIDEQIAQQCTPQEVYDYEWDNYECMYSNDDEEPYQICEHIFGAERCQKEIERNRKMRYLSAI